MRDDDGNDGAPQVLLTEFIEAVRFILPTRTVSSGAIAIWMPYTFLFADEADDLDLLLHGKPLEQRELRFEKMLQAVIKNPQPVEL